MDPAEFGIFVHDVLEHTAPPGLPDGGFAQVSLETVQALAMERAEENITGSTSPCWPVRMTA